MRSEREVYEERTNDWVCNGFQFRNGIYIINFRLKNVLNYVEMYERGLV